MTDRKRPETPDRERVFQAIRDSWCAETCGEPAAWSPGNPSWQQCDASAFIAWEHLGGDLVLGKVFLGGEETEHHYWNRIDGQDFDLTQAQFVDGQEITEVDVVPSSVLQTKADTMRPDLLERIAIMRGKVAAQLDS